MTSKRIKKKKTSFFVVVALLLLCLKIERERIIQKQTISKTHTRSHQVLSSRGGVVIPTKKRERERERNKTRGGDGDLCHFSRSLSCVRKKKKNSAFSREERKHKHNTQHKNTSEKEKKRHKTNKRTSDFFFFFLRRGNTLRTHFGGFIHSFARGKANSLVLLLLLRLRRDQSCFFQEEEEEEILETINKHRVASFELLRYSNTNKRIKEDCAGGIRFNRSNSRAGTLKKS